MGLTLTRALHQQELLQNCFFNNNTQQTHTQTHNGTHVDAHIHPSSSQHPHSVESSSAPPLLIHIQPCAASPSHNNHSHNMQAQQSASSSSNHNEPVEVACSPPPPSTGCASLSLSPSPSPSPQPPPAAAPLDRSSNPSPHPMQFRPVVPRLLALSNNRGVPSCVPPAPRPHSVLSSLSAPIPPVPHPPHSDKHSSATSGSNHQHVQHLHAQPVSSRVASTTLSGRPLVRRPPFELPNLIVPHDNAINDNQQLPGFNIKTEEERQMGYINKQQMIDDGYYDADDKCLYECSPLLCVDGSCSDSSCRICWKQGELLGVGAYGHVYLALNIDNGQLMAVKQVPIMKEEQRSKMSDLAIETLQFEIEVMKSLKHENIVQYLGSQRSVKHTTAKHGGVAVTTSVEAEFFNIFLEYVPGGSIASLLKRFGKFNEGLARIYIKQILQGMAYLHSNHIIHRDIKGGNILVDNMGVCKLADFGAATRLADLALSLDGPKSLHGTVNWMAPEVVKQCGHGRQSDIWSLGATVLEMLTGKPPWHEFTTHVAAMIHIATTQDLPDIPADLSVEAKHFIVACLNRDPSQRPTAQRLLLHPFVTGQKLANSDWRARGTKCGDSSSQLFHVECRTGVAPPLHSGSRRSKTINPIQGLVNRGEQSNIYHNITNTPDAQHAFDPHLFNPRSNVHPLPSPLPVSPQFPSPVLVIDHRHARPQSVDAIHRSASPSLSSTPTTGSSSSTPSSHRTSPVKPVDVPLTHFTNNPKSALEGEQMFERFMQQAQEQAQQLSHGSQAIPSSPIPLAPTDLYSQSNTESAHISPAHTGRAHTPVQLSASSKGHHRPINDDELALRSSHHPPLLPISVANQVSAHVSYLNEHVSNQIQIYAAQTDFIEPILQTISRPATAKLEILAPPHILSTSSSRLSKLPLSVIMPVKRSFHVEPTSEDLSPPCSSAALTIDDNGLMVTTRPAVIHPSRASPSDNIPSTVELPLHTDSLVSDATPARVLARHSHNQEWQKQLEVEFQYQQSMELHNHQRVQHQHS